MRVLVTGGAGYVGSHAVQALIESGHTAIVLDTLECGHKEAVLDAELIVGNVNDTKLVTGILNERKIDCVMHFAASAEVGESMENPMKYYLNNTASTLSLLSSMISCGVYHFIFSSTAATYGEPNITPIPEDLQKQPVNVYGHSKLQTEEQCAWLSKLTKFRYIAFRYFNACGAHPTKPIGEAHQPESHLIPIVLQVPLGKRESVKIMGTDYSTHDGTCIRDYIHVCDLANAHVIGMEYLINGGKSDAFNLGTCQGYSVREIIETARQVTGLPIRADDAPRRAGDPPFLVAKSDKAKSVLGWSPRCSDLKTILSTAWKWHREHPNGF